VVRYTHYSFMVFGYNRMPIVEWLRAQATESLLHAQMAGERITDLGGHPSLGIGRLLETEKHDVYDILQESLEHEKAAIELYRELYELTKDKSMVLEDYARNQMFEEEQHLGEVDKMLRRPGEIEPFQAS
jgi:bacterioferritin